MSSYYDRSAAPYATRRPDTSAPPRTDMYYDRDTPSSTPYASHSDVGYVAHERLPVTRDERAYYQQSQAQGYTALPRESRGLPYDRDESWQSYGRRGSPSPATSFRNSYDYRSSGGSWENSTAARDYETSDAWANRRDASASRLSTLLNSNRVEADVRKYQEPASAGAPVSASNRGYDRTPTEYPLYESRPTSYRERTGRYNPDSYGPPNVYSPQTDSLWPQSTYAQQREIPIPIPIPVSGPSPISNRPSIMDDYKRPPSHVSDVSVSSGWNREARPRHASFSSSRAPRDYRATTGPSGVAPAISVPRHSRELSNEDIALREAMRLSQASRRIVSEPRSTYGYDYREQELPSQGSPPLTVWDPVSYSYVPARGTPSWDPQMSPRGGYDSVPSTVSYQHTYSSAQASPDRRMSRAYDEYSPRMQPHSPDKSVAGRTSIMSLHNIVSPSPAAHPTAKPVTPLMLDEESMDIDLDKEQPPTSRRRLSITRSSPRRVELLNGADTHSGIPPTPPSTKRRQLELLPDFSRPGIEDELEVRPMSESPEPPADPDKAFEEVQTEAAAKAYLSPPKSIHPLLKDSSGLTEDGLRLMPPRPKADQKDIAETLRKAILLRREWEAQSREQRVNPVLIDNLRRNEDREAKPSTATPEDIIKEVRERLFIEAKEEQLLDVRSTIAANFSNKQESVMEKRQRLKHEYLDLHDKWRVHCQRLDSLYKTNEIHESLAQSGRMTRRSTQAHGDVIRSDLEMMQILESLGNEDLVDPNHLAIRNVATIPDMISVEKGSIEYSFDDTNGHVDDPVTFYDPRSGFYDWTSEEEEIFYNKYADYPKQFGIIASFIEHKTPAQCVLYYYIHKKRLIDFRNAASMTQTKRKKGMRKHGKQKGNALLADVQQADRSRPAGRGRRRGRGGANVGEGRVRGMETPPSTAGIGEPTDGRLRRRRAAAVAAAKQFDFDDSQSVDTDTTRDASVAPPKKRRGRKPKSGEAVSGTATPGEGKEGSDNIYTPRRKPVGTATTWTDEDRDVFLRLLAKYGKDFKRISLSLPSKTAQQCMNFYKNHNKEMGLEKIAVAAQERTPSPSTPPVGDQTLQDDDAQVADATSGVGVLTLRNGGTASPAPALPNLSSSASKPLPFHDAIPYSHPAMMIARPQTAYAVVPPMRGHSVDGHIPIHGRPHSAMSLPRYSNFSPEGTQWVPE